MARRARAFLITDTKGGLDHQELTFLIPHTLLASFPILARANLRS